MKRSPTEPRAQKRTCPPLNPAHIERVVALLKKGGLIVMPTDTVYGLAADPFVPGAEERLYRAKSRERGKPIPLLASDLSDIRKFGAVFNALEKRLAAAFWPGPLTLVLRVGNRREGFRIPDHPVARTLLRHAGGILRVTSANRSGEAPALSAQAALRALKPFVAGAIDTGVAPGGVSSTVAQVEKGVIRILRAGALSPAVLNEYA